MGKERRGQEVTLFAVCVSSTKWVSVQEEQQKNYIVIFIFIFKFIVAWVSFCMSSNLNILYVLIPNNLMELLFHSALVIILHSHLFQSNDPPAVSLIIFSPVPMWIFRSRDRNLKLNPCKDLNLQIKRINRKKKGVYSFNCYFISAIDHFNPC